MIIQPVPNTPGRGVCVQAFLLCAYAVTRNETRYGIRSMHHALRIRRRVCHTTRRKLTRWRQGLMWLFSPA